MAENIFEELHQKKQNLISMVAKAKEFKWFDADDTKNKQRAEELIQKINNDTLTIGVIGQMKCGKSTFLNAFVFEDDVLPAATTPMTAALSVITYGEQKKVVAEFYTPNEWEEQKTQAARSIDGLSDLEKSKVQAAQELVEKSKKLGGSLSQYLGRTQDDTFENLEEYVGADGRYVSITKSVKIFYPKEYLKGVEIVDTPGFNDPIVSREERTKEFLKKADVVLMLLYAGRPFDATDRTILFENVRQCGIGKVLIGINKYDIPYANGETEDEIREYVKEELRKASKECGDNTLTEILKVTEPIPLSAEMA
jgi:predicted GTPase